MYKTNLFYLKDRDELEEEDRLETHHHSEGSIDYVVKLI